jgi:hypothetical protein
MIRKASRDEYPTLTHTDSALAVVCAVVDLGSVIDAEDPHGAHVSLDPAGSPRSAASLSPRIFTSPGGSMDAPRSPPQLGFGRWLAQCWLPASTSRGMCGWRRSPIRMVSTGVEVTGWAAGDSVQVIAAIPCGVCRECQAGHATVCASRGNMGYQHDGGFAEFMLVPAKAITVGGLNRIPDGTGPAEASLAEPLACILNAQEQCGVTSGDEVLIIGPGPCRSPTSSRTTSRSLSSPAR